MERDIQLYQKRLFHSPHSGKGGPSIPLPKAVGIVIDDMVGEEYCLTEAMVKIDTGLREEKMAGIIFTEAGENSIGLTITDDNGATHTWQLIKFN